MISKIFLQFCQFWNFVRAWSLGSKFLCSYELAVIFEQIASAPCTSPIKDLHTGWPWGPNEIMPQSHWCLEHRCKDRKGCFPFGVWHLRVPWLYTWSILPFAFLMVPSLLMPPLVLFCELVLLCSLLISCSTALIGSAGLPLFPGEHKLG